MTSGQPNPYAAPEDGWDAPPVPRPASDLGPPQMTLIGNKFVKGGQPEAWKLELYPDRMRILDAEGSVFTEMTKVDFTEKVLLVMFGSTTFINVAQPVRTALGMSAPDLDGLKGWLGPDLQLWMRACLKRRRRTSGITALVFGAWALASGSPILLGYAVVSGLLWILARVAPSRALFLGETLLSAAFVAFLGLAIGVWGTLSWWWGLLGIFALFNIRSTIRMFGFFARA